MQRGRRRASSSSGSSQRMRLGLFLPCKAEARFWASDFVHRDKDNQAALIHIFHELLFLLRLCSGLPVAVRGKLRRYCGNCLVLDLFHLVVRFAAPHHFADCRWVLIIHRRLYYALVYVGCLQAIGRVAAWPPASPHALTAADFDAVFSYRLLSGTAVTPATLLRSLLIGSCALWALIHALPFPVPLLFELPVQAAYLWTGFYYMAQAVTSYFAAPRFNPATVSLCRTLTSLTQPAWLPLPSAHPLPAALCSTPQRTWVLILFLQLYGSLLTLFLSYLVERHLKLRFLQHLRSIRPAADPSAPRNSTHTTPPSPPVHPHHPLPSTPPIAHLLHGTPATAAAAAAAAATSDQAPPSGQATPGTPATAAAAATSGQAPPSGQATHAPRPPLAASAPASQHTSTPDLLKHLRSLCTHVLVLWLLAAVAWNLVVACRIPLARTLTPMPYRGAHLDWYWKLLSEGAGGSVAAPQ